MKRNIPHYIAKKLNKSNLLNDENRLPRNKENQLPAKKNGGANADKNLFSLKRNKANLLTNITR
jgi:hypothetical protein